MGIDVRESSDTVTDSVEYKPMDWDRCTGGSPSFGGSFGNCANGVGRSRLVQCSLDNNYFEQQCNTHDISTQLLSEHMFDYLQLIVLQHFGTPHLVQDAGL
jgi:phosphoribosyl 1,2-cyclic phosphodiesterase